MTLKNHIASAGFVLAFVSMTLAPKHASAAVIYDNLTIGSGAVTGGAAGISTAGNGPLADSFSTGSTGGYLTDVKLLLEAITPADGGTFTFSVLSDNSNTPGSAILTDTGIPDSLLSTTLHSIDVMILVSVAPSLAANTRYWIELSGTPASTARWSFDSTNVGTGVAGEYNYYSGSVAANSALTPYQMEVTVTPEPATWTLLAAALALVPAARRKFRF